MLHELGSHHFKRMMKRCHANQPTFLNWDWTRSSVPHEKWMANKWSLMADEFLLPLWQQSGCDLTAKRDWSRFLKLSGDERVAFFVIPLHYGDLERTIFGFSFSDANCTLHPCPILWTSINRRFRPVPLSPKAFNSEPPGSSDYNS